MREVKQSKKYRIEGGKALEKVKALVQNRERER